MTPAHRATRRLVSLVPSLTEAIVDLGRGAWLVGVSDYCPSVAGTRRLGGPRDAAVDQILNLDPDIVIGCKEENSKSTFEQLRGRVETRVFSVCSLEDAFACLLAMGEICSAAASAARIAARTRRRLARIRAAVRAPARYCYPVWRDPWIVVGGRSFAAEMLAAAGGESIFGDAPEAYPRVAWAEIEARDPQIVLLPDEPYAFGEADREHFRHTPAGRRDAVHCIPGRWAAWYGTRMAAGLTSLWRCLQRRERPGR